MRYLMLMLAVVVWDVSGSALAAPTDPAASAPADAAPTKELTLADKVAKLKRGITTYDEVLHTLGQPTTFGTGPNETQYLTYFDSHWFGGSFLAKLNFKAGILTSMITQKY